MIYPNLDPNMFYLSVQRQRCANTETVLSLKKKYNMDKIVFVVV